MTDRRNFSYVPNTIPTHAGQWAASTPAHYSSAGHYQSSSYGYAQTNGFRTGMHPSSPPYATSGMPQSPVQYPGAEYATVPSHPSMTNRTPSGVYSQQPMYISSENMPTTHSSRQPIPIPRSHPSHGYPMPNSHSSRNSMTVSPPYPSPNYSSHGSPPIDHMAQYPASPTRPFSCDMCALSFNRQHDLKRHRETHSGEKPFFCNGGCGKTFTRKDALKRHQLVKHCGHEEDA